MINTNQKIDVSQIAGMFERIEEIKQAQARQFIDQFTNFIPRFVEAQKDAELMGRKNAPDFNIFRFLNYERQEKLHSRFISYLLNPRESHEQGHLFLECFLNNLQNIKANLKNTNLPLPEVDIKQGVWLVQREVFCRFGHLDIVLRNKKLSTMYVIENKISAKEQPDQIKRYGQYLEEHEKDYRIRGLLFLTVSGYSSVTADKVLYYPISYKELIKDWLEKVLDQVEAETVRGTVRQYISLIQDL